MRRAIVGLSLMLAVAPRAASAFCGFYVGGSDKKLYNDATMVVLMREGMRTVLSMRNNYKGPPEDFAMVVPVPVVLQKENVKTLPPWTFDQVDTIAAPRLVEYWEQDPCYRPPPPPPPMPMSKAPSAAGRAMERADADHGVKIEAQFEVAEYEILILSAKDAAGLDTWLRERRYRIPDGAAEILRPYVQGGSKFFVAKVNAKKVQMDATGQAVLSPLRFHYDAESFGLPIRLGLINSSGTQDLIVHILSRGQRYEVANYPNAIIPTNLDVHPKVKDRFAAFYASLFDSVLARNPGAVVTEYAWEQITPWGGGYHCDPCTGPPPPNPLWMSLGADVLGIGAAGSGPSGRGFVLTRLHARYGKSGAGQDLVFRAAPPIAGGQEAPDARGKLSQGAAAGGMNTFQARYAIRHPWTGRVSCKRPRWGIWGGPPSNLNIAYSPKPAKNLAGAPRGEKLSDLVAVDVPTLKLRALRKGGSGYARWKKQQAPPQTQP